MRKSIFVVLMLFLVGCTNNNGAVSQSNEDLLSNSDAGYIHADQSDDKVTEPIKEDVDYINEIKDLPLTKLVGGSDVPSDLTLGDFFNTQYFIRADWTFSKSVEPGCEVICNVSPNDDVTVKFRFYTIPTLEFDIEKGQYCFGKYQWEHEVLFYNGGYGQVLSPAEYVTIIKQWLQSFGLI